MTAPETFRVDVLPGVGALSPSEWERILPDEGEGWAYYNPKQKCPVALSPSGRSLPLKLNKTDHSGSLISSHSGGVASVVQTSPWAGSQTVTAATPSAHVRSLAVAKHAHLQVKIARGFRLVKHFFNPDMAGPVRNPPAKGIAFLVAEDCGANTGANR